MGPKHGLQCQDIRHGDHCAECDIFSFWSAFPMPIGRTCLVLRNLPLLRLLDILPRYAICCVAADAGLEVTPNIGGSTSLC